LLLPILLLILLISNTLPLIFLVFKIYF
jgi:hypothetical protein